MAPKEWLQPRQYGLGPPRRGPRPGMGREYQSIAPALSVVPEATEGPRNARAPKWGPRHPRGGPGHLNMGHEQESLDRERHSRAPVPSLVPEATEWPKKVPNWGPRPSKNGHRPPKRGLQPGKRGLWTPKQREGLSAAPDILISDAVLIRAVP